MVNQDELPLDAQKRQVPKILVLFSTGLFIINVNYIYVAAPLQQHRLHAKQLIISKRQNRIYKEYIVYLHMYSVGIGYLKYNLISTLLF